MSEVGGGSEVFDTGEGIRDGVVGPSSEAPLPKALGVKGRRAMQGLGEGLGGTGDKGSEESAAAGAPPILTGEKPKGPSGK